jgi:cell wall-associated NlpC family hydrolase
MSVSSAVLKLNHDLSRMKKAQGTEKDAETRQKTAVSNEKTAAASLKTRQSQVVDEFSSGQITSAQERVALKQLSAEGSKTERAFTRRDEQDQKAIVHDKKAVAKDRHQALEDLKPAEYELGLKATNRDRQELGLNAVHKVIRAPFESQLSKAVSIATRAVDLEQSQHCYDYTEDYGARTNYGLGVLSKQRDGRITFDCSGFVGAVYRAAGLPSPYTVGYAGTSYDVAACKNMKQISGSEAKPGDVVVFPDHIALCIGDGKCISMGEEGEPKVVTIAEEAAYENRGIQGCYAPKGS